jgi:hypothetical protein
MILKKSEEILDCRFVQLTRISTFADPYAHVVKLVDTPL